MQRDADASLSNNEKEFIIQALKQERRVDGRGPYEMREPKFQFSLDDTSCTVLLGRTRVMTVITASLEAPYPDRPNEGSVRFNVEFSPMASPAFEAGRPGEQAVEVARLIERGLRESRAVDQEALVVVSGRKVWHLRVDVHVLDHQGNLVDACGLSALGALMAFRRPDATVGGGPDGQAVTVHSPDVREPLPLSIHHLPVPVSFAFFEDGGLLVVDPGLKEEAASSGGLTVTVNPHGELCAVQKASGVGLPPSEIMRCIRVAAKQVEDITAKLKKALEAHAVARVQARVRRRAPAEPEPPAALRTASSGGAAAQAAAAAAALPQPVQEILQKLEEPEDESADDSAQEDEGEGAANGGDVEMAAVGEQEAGGVAAGGSAAREAPGEDGMEEEEQAAAGPASQEQQQQQAAAAGAEAASQGQQQGKKQKPKRKRRAGQAAGGGGGGGGEPDQFELIASIVASAGGKQQQQQQCGGGLEGAVRQRTPGSSGKRGKAPKS